MVWQSPCRNYAYTPSRVSGDHLSNLQPLILYFLFHIFVDLAFLLANIVRLALDSRKNAGLLRFPLPFISAWWYLFDLFFTWISSVCYSTYICTSTARTPRHYLCRELVSLHRTSYISIIFRCNVRSRVAYFSNMKQTWCSHYVITIFPARCIVHPCHGETEGPSVNDLLWNSGVVS